LVRLGKTIEERDKISDAHQTTISELKRKYGKQLDKTLKDENDRLKSQLNKLHVDNAELRSDVDRLRTR
jgi:DNA anti-recombination protein RmuC